ESEDDLEVVSTPMVLASNSRAATLFVGEERVLTTGVTTQVLTAADGPTTTLVTPITEVRSIGNTLRIVPRVNADKRVTLSIFQESSNLAPQSSVIPVTTSDGSVRAFPIDSVDTASLNGTVVAKNGLTVAVGGLIRTTVTEGTEKVPFLGDLPLVGRFFRNERESRRKTELVLLITPYVLSTPGEGQERTLERMRALSTHAFHAELDEAHAEHFRDRDGPEDQEQDR
ncbi:MAG: type II secretion system protein GspD, partial [Planctomycetota bacterium]